MNIGFKENLTIEFKSDKSKLPDSDLVDAIVAFANTNGGDLYLGVEDNGDITGLHKSHQDITQLSAFIANKTVPPIAVRAEKSEDKQYLKISVPKSRSIVASSGKIQRRRIKADGTPENFPMYPHEIASRLSDLSLLDYSESTNVMVKLFIPKSLPDPNFTRLISEEHRTTGESLPINSLLVLNALKLNRRATVNELADFSHITVEKARITAERLVESGMIEPSGNGKGRCYTLSAKLYQANNNISGYIRQKGIDSIRYPEMVLQFAKENGGTITRGDVMELLHLTKSQAYNLLKKMVDDDKLDLKGTTRNAYYILKH